MSEIILTDAPQISVNELLLAKGAAEVLHKHYPQYLWAVNVTDGVMDIRCMNLSGRWGYTLHIPATYSASEWDRRVMRAGGEILERYRQRRGQFDPERVSEAPRDFAKNLIFDR